MEHEKPQMGDLETSLKTHARDLLDSLERGNFGDAVQVIHDLNKARDQGLYFEVGKLTRELHNSIVNFQIDLHGSHAEEVSQISDATERLNYVVRMTEKAANRTMDLVEESAPLVNDLSSESRSLGADWARFMRREVGADEFRELAKRIEAMEEKEGRKLGGRARKRLKEDLVVELLPRAFVRPVQTNATLDLEHGFIAVDASSKKAAESVVSELRHALGSFPALPLNAEASVRVILTGWLAGEPLPPGLSLGDECELKDPVDGGAVVRCSRHELQVDEIRQHLEAGKQVTRLALVLDDHVGFVLGEDLVLRKLKFLDGAVDQLEGTESDGVAAELDARFALMAGELKRLFAVLEPALKFSRADA